MGRARARELVFSLAAVSVHAIGLNSNSVSHRGGPPAGGPEGIHMYNSADVENRHGGVEITTEDPGHHWPTVRGRHIGSGNIETDPPPANLASHLSWTWTPPQDKFQSVIAGGPVIDHHKNIFVAATDGLRKFSPEGSVLWHHKSYGGLAHAPCLHGSMVFTSHTNGNLMGLDSHSGRVLWSRRWSKRSPKEGVFPAAHDDLFVFGTEVGDDPRRPGGAQLAWALDAETGWLRWVFRGDNAFVNFSPIFPGDNSMVLMDFTGMVYRVNLNNGHLMWKNRGLRSFRSYTEGGAVLGPHKTIYTCSNPGTSYGQEGEKGILHAFNLTTGESLWSQELPHPCNSVPSVAEMKGPKKGHSVVVTPGSKLRKPNLHGSVMAFNAETGALEWRYQAPRLNDIPGASKLYWEGSPNRTEYDGTCYPQHWSAPRIASDGSVWASRADGKIYNVRGPPEGFEGSPDVALARAGGMENFETDLDFQTTAGVQVQQTTVDGPSMAGAMAFSPGMTVMASCNKLHVYTH